MLFTLTLIFTLAAFAADWIHLRHQRRRGTPALRSFIIWALATDALPLVSAIVGWICRDNGPGVMNLYMWLFWAWIVTVLPRMLYYVFHFLKLPRAGLLTASLLTLYLLWGTTFGRTRIHVNRVEIRSDRILILRIAHQKFFCPRCSPRFSRDFRFIFVIDLCNHPISLFPPHLLCLDYQLYLIPIRKKDASEWVTSL